MLARIAGQRCGNHVGVNFGGSGRRGGGGFFGRGNKRALTLARLTEEQSLAPSSSDSCAEVVESVGNNRVFPAGVPSSRSTPVVRGVVTAPNDGVGGSSHDGGPTNDDTTSDVLTDFPALDVGRSFFASAESDFGGDYHVDICPGTTELDEFDEFDRSNKTFSCGEQRELLDRRRRSFVVWCGHRPSFVVWSPPPTTGVLPPTGAGVPPTMAVPPTMTATFSQIYPHLMSVDRFLRPRKAISEVT